MASCYRLVFPDLREALVALRLVVVIVGAKVEFVSTPDSDDFLGHFGGENIGAHVSYVVGFGRGPDHHGEGVDTVVEKTVGVWPLDEFLGFFPVGAM